MMQQLYVYDVYVRRDDIDAAIAISRINLGPEGYIDEPPEQDDECYADCFTLVSELPLDDQLNSTAGIDQWEEWD